jgi:hypothetical protein
VERVKNEWQKGGTVKTLWPRNKKKVNSWSEWEDNIKMHVREVVLVVVIWI